jgi:hypothetical protein
MNSEIKETKNIRVAMIIETIGKPPEHLVETLENIIKNIDEEKGVSISESKIKEPTRVKDSKEFYTTFADIEIEVEEILQIAILMFKYMPAHIEIIHPELIALTNSGWNDVFNELTRRLHGYDEIAKILQMQNTQMQKKLKEALSEKNVENKISKEENIKKNN